MPTEELKKLLEEEMYRDLKDVAKVLADIITEEYCKQRKEEK